MTRFSSSGVMHTWQVIQPFFHCSPPGFMIFVKLKEGLWCRASVVEVLQNGCVEAVKACPVDQLASIRVFFLDYGLTKSISIQRYTQKWTEGIHTMIGYERGSIRIMTFNRWSNQSVLGCWHVLMWYSDVNLLQGTPYSKNIACSYTDCVPCVCVHLGLVLAQPST